MIAERIRKLEIEKRGLYTAIYGHISDDFLGEDLKRYNFDQQIYFYLKSEDFDYVIFLDRHYKFYSFNQGELESFVRINTSKREEINERQFTSNIKSPLRGAIQNSNKRLEEVSNHSPASPVSLALGGSESFYRSSNPDIYRCIKNLLEDDGSRMALIVKSPNVAKMDVELSENLEALFASSKAKRRGKFKVIVVYNQTNEGDLVQEFRMHQNNNELTFYSSFFGNEFFNINNQQEYELTSNCYKIETPGLHEINYMFHYNRLVNKRKIDFIKLRRVNQSVFNMDYDGASIMELSQADIDKIQGEITEETPTLEILQGLIGLKSVKENIEDLITSIELHQERFNRKQVDSKYSEPLNYIFRGNPGTGKTTVARLFGKILQEIGILERGHLVEANRQDLVSDHIGGTALKTTAKIEEALGGVLFIDEAYSLTDMGPNDFGKEAMVTLLEAMTNPKYVGKVAFVVAGYPKEMDDFINSNPGLNRRFGHQVDFDDYTSDELLAIFEKQIKKEKYALEKGVKSRVLEYLYSLTRDQNFGNAGVVIDLTTRIIKNQKRRIKQGDIAIKKVSDTELETIMELDVPEPLLTIKNDTSVTFNISAKETDEIETTSTASANEAESFADEVLLIYDENNDGHRFVRGVCNEVEEVILQSIAAYQGEENFEIPLRNIENDEFKKRIITVAKYKDQINFDRFQEIGLWLDAFRSFFRGILSINQNEILTAIKYFKESQVFAEDAQLDEMVKTNKFLSKYWEILNSVTNEDDFSTIQSRLKDLKNDIDLSSVGEQYREMSDLMQADLSFISAVKALNQNNIERFKNGINQSTTLIEKAIDNYLINGALIDSPNIISLKGVASFYRLLGDMVQLLYKIDQENFDLTRELSNLGIHSHNASRFFEMLDLSSNLRFTNMYYLIKGFSDLRPFIQELSIIMTNFQLTGKLPNKNGLDQLKDLSIRSKENFQKIQDDSLNFWVDIGEDLIEYARNIGMKHTKDSNLIKSFDDATMDLKGFAREKIVEEIDFQDQEDVKHHFQRLVLEVRKKEAVDLLEQHLPYIISMEKRQTAIYLISQFRERRQERRMEIIYQPLGQVGENKAFHSILGFVSEL